jgi:hypothetical protein
MTELPDLITSPAERLAYRMREFVEELEQKHKREEAALDRLLEEKRTRIHRLHMKVESAYKEMFDELLVKLNRDEDAEILEWFELVQRTKRKDLVAEIASRAAPVLREIEARGGQLEVDIRASGEGTSGCMFRERKGGYFSFVGEFLDGFDDDIVYTIKRETKSEAQRKREKNEWLERHCEEWRAKEKAKRFAAEELERSVGAADAALRERSLEQAVADVTGCE